MNDVKIMTVMVPFELWDVAGGYFTYLSDKIDYITERDPHRDMMRVIVAADEDIYNIVDREMRRLSTDAERRIEVYVGTVMESDEQYSNKTVGERWHEEVEEETPTHYAIAIGVIALSFILFLWFGAMSYAQKAEAATWEPETFKAIDEHRYYSDPIAEKLDIPESEPAEEADPDMDEGIDPEPVPEITDGPGNAYSNYQASSPDAYENSFKAEGVRYGEDGTRYTWYSQNALPGGGLAELNGNGRHIDESTGYIMDGDGYIAVASSDHVMGTVLDTPWGEAKVYDTGCASGTVDVYTDF